MLTKFAYQLSQITSVFCLIMAGIAALQQYDSGSDEESSQSPDESETVGTSTDPKSGWADILPDPKASVTKSLAVINAAPEVFRKEEIFNKNIIKADTKELTYNPRYEELFAPHVRFSYLSNEILTVLLIIDYYITLDKCRSAL